MKVYEAKVTYKSIDIGRSEPLNTPEKVVEYMKTAFEKNPEQESFWVIALNRKNCAKGRFLISLGTQTNTVVHPREIFLAAIRANSAAIIVVHNHPSGDPTPSNADLQITRQLREAAKILCIDLLDHVIIGDSSDDPQGQGFYSFRNAGLI